jgi:hypothetical protein
VGEAAGVLTTSFGAAGAGEANPGRLVVIGALQEAL